MSFQNQREVFQTFQVKVLRAKGQLTTYTSCYWHSTEIAARSRQKIWKGTMNSLWFGFTWSHLVLKKVWTRENKAHGKRNKNPRFRVRFVDEKTWALMKKIAMLLCHSNSRFAIWPFLPYYFRVLCFVFIFFAHDKTKPQMKSQLRPCKQLFMDDVLLITTFFYFISAFYWKISLYFYLKMNFSIRI